MARGGNNKLPTAMKRLRGSLRKGREAAVSVAPTAEVGEPPAALSTKEKAVWAALAPEVAATYSDRDRTAFTLLVRMYAKLQDPKVKAYAFVGLARVVVGMLERFGCTPNARMRVPVTKPGDEVDEVEQFLFSPPQLFDTRKPEPQKH